MRIYSGELFVEFTIDDLVTLAVEDLKRDNPTLNSIKTTKWLVDCRDGELLASSDVSLNVSFKFS